MGSNSRMMTRRLGSLKQLWFTLNQNVRLFLSHLIPFKHVISHPFRHIPAPVKQTSGPRSWNKTARRRGTDVFAPIVNRSEDPEPGIFRVKTQVGTNQKGGLVTEGGVSRRGSFSLARPIGGVSFTHSRLELSADPGVFQTLRTSTFLGSKSLKKLLQT